MAQEGEVLSCNVDAETAQAVDAYREERGYEHKSQAIRDLLEAGLRETKSPLLSRWRDQVINWAGLLSVFALVSLAAGLVTPGISAYTGYLMAVTLAAMAAAIVGLLELARVRTGQSVLVSKLSRVRSENKQ